MIDLSTSYMGLSLRNPFVAASSGITNQVEDLEKLEKAGIGAVVLKSIFEEEIRIELQKNMQKMQQQQFIYPETTGFFEETEVEDSLSSYLKLIKQAKEKISVPVLASINCLTAEKWPYYAKTLEEAGADGLELNVFILPSETKIFDKSPEQRHMEIIHAVKNQVNIPVAVKISQYFSNLALFIDELDAFNADAIVLFNRSYSPDIQIDSMELTASNIYSTPGEITLPLRWIGIMSGRVNADLAASTGVHTGEGAIKQILAGAQVVQLASTLYMNGFRYPG